jgi:hypothetical protein
MAKPRFPQDFCGFPWFFSGKRLIFAIFGVGECGKPAPGAAQERFATACAEPFRWPEV